MPVLPLVGSTMNRIGPEPPVPLGPFEHRPGHAVLDAPAGIEKLRLGKNPLALELQERSVADQIENVVGKHDWVAWKKTFGAVLAPKLAGRPSTVKPILQAQRRRCPGWRFAVRLP